MNSLAPARESLEYRMKTQNYLLSCIDEEKAGLEKEKGYLTSEEYEEILFELEEYRKDVLSELIECQESLKKFENKNKNLVLRQMGFKKGGQSW